MIKVTNNIPKNAIIGFLDTLSIVTEDNNIAPTENNIDKYIVINVIVFIYHKKTTSASERW